MFSVPSKRLDKKKQQRPHPWGKNLKKNLRIINRQQWKKATSLILIHWPFSNKFWLSLIEFCRTWHFSDSNNNNGCSQFSESHCYHLPHCYALSHSQNLNCATLCQFAIVNAFKSWLSLSSWKRFVSFVNIFIDENL